MDQAVITTDLAGNVTSINQRGIEMLAISNPCVGQPLSDLSRFGTAGGISPAIQVNGRFLCAARFLHPVLCSTLTTMQVTITERRCCRTWASTKP